MCPLQDVKPSGYEATLLVDPVEGPHGTLGRIAINRQSGTTPDRTSS
jgi:hypothetical protein